MPQEAAAARAEGKGAGGAREAAESRARRARAALGRVDPWPMAAAVAAAEVRQAREVGAMRVRGWQPSPHARWHVERL